MAGIDHTIIAFHNGKLMCSLIKEEGAAFRSLIPKDLLLHQSSMKYDN